MKSLFISSIIQSKKKQYVREKQTVRTPGEKK